MARTKGSKSRRDVTILCEWCGEHHETSREDTRFCSPKCRGRMFGFVRMAGFEPGYIPGDQKPEDVFALLVDTLLRRERDRRAAEKAENIKAAILAASRSKTNA